MVNEDRTNSKIEAFNLEASREKYIFMGLGRRSKLVIQL